MIFFFFHFNFALSKDPAVLSRSPPFLDFLPLLAKALCQIVVQYKGKKFICIDLDVYSHIFIQFLFYLILFTFKYHRIRKVNKKTVLLFILVLLICIFTSFRKIIVVFIFVLLIIFHSIYFSCYFINVILEIWCIC